MDILKLAKADWIKLVKNPKTWIIVLLCFFFFWNETIQIRSLAQYHQLGITPYFYPVFMVDWRRRMYALVLIVMLLGEAPYYNGAEVFICMRISVIKWFCAKILYIICVSVVFQAVMVIMSIIVCLPYVGIDSQWGDVIITYINSIQGLTSSAGIVDGESIISMTPLIAMLWEFVLMTLLSIIIAMIMFVINGVAKSIVGTVLVGSLIIIDLYCTELSSFGLIKWNVNYFFPTTWIDINNLLTVDGLGFTNCVVYMLLIIIALLLVGFVLVHKKVIKPVNNV